MIKNSLITVIQVFVKVFLSVITGTLIIGIGLSLYLLGYYRGFVVGRYNTSEQYSDYVSNLIQKYSESRNITPTPVVIVKQDSSAQPATGGLLRDSAWGGPDLWNAVNKRRVELGVNSLNQSDNLCTIASIRLNELLELGTLDGHEGFSTMTDKRPDLKPIFDEYSTVAEFLAAGADSAEQTVSLWENSLGHKKLLTGGEFVWGCIYAQNSFAVAIAAF